MDLPPPDFRLLHVQMAPVPPRQRLDFWRDLLARKLFAVDIQPLKDDAYRVEACLRMLPELTIGWGSIDASINRRTQRLVAADNDDFFLTVNLEGKLGAEQNGREISLGVGQGYILACTEKGSFHRPMQGRIMCLRLPAAALSLRVPDLYDRIARPIAQDNEALQLLLHYAQMLQANLPLQSPELRSVIARHIYDLVAMTLTTSRETRAFSVGGLRAARFHAIKSYIVANLHRHDLNVNMVADQNRLGPRQIQRLFESEGMTFSEYVLKKRLDKVHEALLNPHMRHRGISDLAYECGFGDVSHFNRVFRRRFGASPSEVRSRL